MAWRRGPTGVGERGAHTLGFSRNLGEPVVSTRIARFGPPGDPRTCSPSRSARRVREQTRAQRVVPRRKETKVSGMGGGCHRALIVLTKPGNSDPEDPVEERGGPGIRDRWRERWQGHRTLEPHEGEEAMVQL